MFSKSVPTLGPKEPTAYDPRSWLLWLTLGSLMKLLAELEASSTVYSVCFSPTGDCLAWGGGHWYGGGFIGMASLESLPLLRPRDFLAGIEEDVVAEIRAGLASALGRELTPSEAHNAAWFSVSGVAFDRQGRHLVASAWQACQRYSPAMIFGIDGCAAACPKALVDEAEWVRAYGGKGILDRPATGVLLHAGQVIIRRESPDPRLVLCVLRAEGIETDECGAEHASHGVTGLGSVVLTAASQDTGSELLMKQLDTADLRGQRTVGVVSAIAASAEQQRVLTGSSDGTLSTWLDEGEHLRQVETWGGHGSRVTAACCTADGTGSFVTADDVGNIAVWDGRTSRVQWQVPLGRVRSLAADPGGRLLAVACKCGAPGDAPYGRIFLYDIS